MEFSIVCVEVIYIPKRIIDEAKRRGIDIEEVVLKALASIVNADNYTIALARIEIAEKMLSEAKEYIARRDVVQASEKLYKVVEECIKTLAEVLKISQLKEVEKRSKWDTWLLGKASREISEKLGEEKITLIWAKAYEIHIWGFHEVKYDVKDIEIALPLVEWLLNYTKQTLEKMKA